MSSHREAPTISKDPVADNTDLYAFVDPVDTSKVTILSNFIPLEEPAGGPNFFQFGDVVLYEILIDNDGDGVEDVTYQFRFKTTTQNPATFRYNTGPIGSLTEPNWNARRLTSVPECLGPRGTAKTDLRRRGFDPTDPEDARSVIGVWSAASRRKAMVREKDARVVQTGPWVQVSRLGEPLINEVVIELGEKDLWNSQAPAGDSQFVDDYAQPGLQTLLPILYPGVFPNLAGLAKSGKTRADLIAILLTGIPPGVIMGFQNSNGPTQADELRLNLAFAPSYAATDSDINPPGDSPKRFGILRGFVDGVFDFDGFPNGRRVFDNATAIELRAIAGLTFPLVDNTFTPDGAAGLLMDGTKEDLPFLSTFPYLATPYEGFEHSHD